jgi:hypothetical protein
MAETGDRMPRVAKGKRPRFHREAGVDPLFGVVAALAAELWAARERIATLERVLEHAGSLPAGAVEADAPDPETVASRQAEREAFIQRVFQALEDYR